MMRSRLGILQERSVKLITIFGAMNVANLFDPTVLAIMGPGISNIWSEIKIAH
jgi:hypothetical protein